MIIGKHKGQMALANGLMHMRIAQMNFGSFALDNPGSNKARLFNLYDGKIGWILNDIVINPVLSPDTRAGIKKIIQSDVLVIPSIAEKVALLTEENRHAIESLIDCMIAGEKLTVETIKEENV